ncbi:hypothetical protein RUND412_001042 [Rhizina undulata]
MASADRSTENEEFFPSLYRPSTILPISKHRNSLLYLVEKYPVTIVVGQTGSGKTTQLPQYLYQAGWTKNEKIIACTQPRRVAATTVATRVAEEMGVRCGEEVGYSIRFEDMTSLRTRIKYMTDGMLLREALVDPLLSRYSVIMVDEAHERSLSTDMLLGVLKKIRRKRKELRLIISSATLQAEDFVRFFTSGEGEEGIVEKGKGKKKAGEEKQELAKIISLEGRCYPVDILYLEEPTENYVEKAIQTVFDIHTKEGEGDILVFLTGREEIETAVDEIRSRSANLHPRAPKLLPLPMYAGLPTDQQLLVFDPAPENHRKVIISTNIAEASVTISDISFVIDCGFVKIRAFNPFTGIESLTVVPVSKASATQRAGRAGRTKPGKCFRLYTESAYNGVLKDTSVPEIQRSNLAPVVLQLKALGIDNIVRFDFLTSPPSELLVRALELLFALGALDDYARLTKPLGTRMAEMPLDPMTAKILLNSIEFGCTDQILSIAAMTTVQNVFITHDGDKKPAESAKRKFAVEEGDHLTLLNVYESFVTKGQKSSKWCRDHYLNFKSLSRAVSVRAQLKRYVERFNVDLGKGKGEGLVTGETIRRCLVTGYFAHAARMQPDGTFRAVNGDVVFWAHPSSVMFNRKADWVIFHEVVETGTKTFIRDITTIQKDWLLDDTKKLATPRWLSSAHSASGAAHCPGRAGTFRSTISFHLHRCGNAGRMLPATDSTAPEMVRNQRPAAGSATSSLALMLTCFVVIVALRWPAVLSRYRKYFGIEGSSPSATKPLSGASSLHPTPTSAAKYDTGKRIPARMSLLLRSIHGQEGTAQCTARERVLLSLQKAKGWPNSTNNPRGRLLSAMVGFMEYKNKMDQAVKKKTDMWENLDARHRELMSDVPYHEKLIRTIANIRTNDELIQEILDYGLSFYNIPFSEVVSFQNTHAHDPRPVADQTSVIQALKHFVRDWSSEGANEREAIFPQILTTLENLYPKCGERKGVRVLVPGAGLGRLSYEIADMGFSTVANEWSFYITLCNRWLFSLDPGRSKERSWTFHPFINWWSHQRTTTSLLREVSFPDVVPSLAAQERLSLVEGDFTTSFLSEAGTYDVVVTLFFIDTARNIVDYLEKIYSVLKPGGTWINLGPLLYGTAPWVEFSLDELLVISEKAGFELLPTDEKWGDDTFGEVEKWRGKVRGKIAGYSWDQESMTRNAYLAQFWVARKKVVD